MSDPEESPRPEERRLVVTEDTNDRLDRYLADRLRLSRSFAADLITAGHVRVNGAPPRKSYRPEPGDEIEVEIPPRRMASLEPEDLPFGLVHEDEHLAVIEKPSGMVVHPAPGNPSGTLVNALLHRLDRLSAVGGELRPGIVHRLDKETSGLLVVAKTDVAHRGLAQAISERRVRRGYLAAAWGHLEENDLTIERPVGRDPKDRKRMAVVKDGKRAVTHVRRLESWRAADLFAVRLETGRTHQIRVHLRSLGHPVVCDPIYAPRWERGFLGAGGRWAEELARRASRLFLHAAHLAFSHPVTREPLSFKSPLPEPLASAVEWARESSAPPA